MTLLFMDGYDVGDLGYKYQATATAVVASSSGTRFSVGSALVMPSGQTTQTVLQKDFTASAKVIMGFAVKMATLSDTVDCLRLFGDGGTVQHLALRFMTSGAVAVYSSGTQRAISAAGLFATGGWYYVEISATVNDSTGAVTVKINGTTALTFTGDTKNAGTSATLDRFTFQNVATTAGLQLDDLYVCDGLGTTNNDFLGDVRIQTLMPTGAGSSTQFTPTGSSNNWDNVDEQPWSASDYNSDSVSGHRDLYAIADLIAGTTGIKAVQHNMITRKNDSGLRQIKTAVKSGASVYTGVAVTVGSADVWAATVRETDPATSAAWTVSGLNALEAGAEIV